MMQTLLNDIRYGIRLLLNKPGFAVVAVLTLALGIGATTAIFSVVNGVLLRPLPYPDAENLIYVGQQFRSRLAGSGEPKFLFWRENNQSFDSLAAYSSFGGAGGNLAGGREAEYVQGLRVSQEFFRVLGVYPAAGRPFTREEDTFGSGSFAILSDGLWRRQFGANQGLLGETVLLNDKPVTVVGIMPPRFRFLGADLFVPMQARPEANHDPNAEVVGRLKSGITLDEAREELKLIAEKYRSAFPKQMSESESVGAQPYRELFTDGIDRYLWILLGAVGLLLLIACANVANLQLTRAVARQREVAVRMAIGASGGRILRQLLTEGLLLALTGGAAGLLLALWGTELLTTAVPQGLLPPMAVISVDWRVMGFCLAAALVTGILFSLVPAWQSRRVDVNTALKENAAKGVHGRGRLRGALVIAEVALSLVLLVAAGLLTRTYINVSSVEPGFDPHNVLTCRIALNGKRYDTTVEASSFYRQALERITAIPGVESAAVINKLPLDWQFNMPIVFPDRPDQVESVQFRMISPDYFRVMKIEAKQGRLFTDADDATAPPVAMVTEAFVRTFTRGQDPFDVRFSIGRGLGDPQRSLVGVVADVKQSGLDRAAPAIVFVPIPQMSDRLMATVRAFNQAHFTVRTMVEPARIGAAVTKEIAAIDPTIPLSQIASMEEISAKSVGPQRFNMLLLVLFASLGLALAAIGNYGVVSHVVAQRTNEIGLRMALGAQTRDMVTMILRYGLALASVGIAAGLIASFALTRLMTTFLFGINPTDPVTFVAISAVLMGVALISSWIPARRAARVDPMVALRYE